MFACFLLENDNEKNKAKQLRAIIVNAFRDSITPIDSLSFSLMPDSTLYTRLCLDR